MPRYSQVDNQAVIGQYYPEPEALGPYPDEEYERIRQYEIDHPEVAQDPEENSQ